MGRKFNYLLDMLPTLNNTLCIKYVISNKNKINTKKKKNKTNN